MKILVTGSAGHLGEALMRTLATSEHEVVGLDLKPSVHTDRVGTIADADFVRECMQAVDAVIHTATLHKPHIGTHSRQAFIATNVSGTLNLLEAASAGRCHSFIFTSTTSAFGDAMQPPPGEPAVWVTEDLPARPKNIYGVSKTAAEDLCRLFHRNTGLACVILRTARFFPEDDDDLQRRETYAADNLKVNELLFRRADLADIVSAHLLALEHAPKLGFESLLITATTPLQRADAGQLRTAAPEIVERYVPAYRDAYGALGWQMFGGIERVYDNSRARAALGWLPQYTFELAVERLLAGEDFRSPLARTVGSKGYHDRRFADGVYPVEGF